MIYKLAKRAASVSTSATTPAGKILVCAVQDPENQQLKHNSDNLSPASARANAPASPLVSAGGQRNAFFFNERGLRAGWRFLIYIVLLFILVTVLGTILRPFRRTIESVVGNISEFLLLVCVLLGTFIMAKIERRSLFDYGLRDRRAIPHWLSGALIGFCSLTLMLLGFRAAHDFYFGPEAMHGSALAMAALSNVIGFVLVALFEETTFRGYAFYTLIDGMGFLPAAVAMSLLFAFVHTQNPGEAPVGIVAVFAFGMMLVFSIWRTGSLLWAIGFHFMWDYSETFIYGVPDSGFVSPQHLLSARFSGPAWITGGTVGPEGSYFIFLVLAVVALAIHLFYPQRKIESAVAVGLDEEGAY